MWSKATSCFLFGVLLLPALRAGEDIPVLIERLKTDDYAVYRATLARLAQAGEAAVPDLIRALDEPSIRYDAMEALRRIGRPAVPELVRSVQAGNGMAIETLGRIGPAAAEAVPVLNTLVTNRHLAGPTAMALSRIGAAGVPGLMAGIEKGDSRQRLDYANQLGLVGPPAREAAVPVLLKLLADSEMQDRSALLLGRIAPGSVALTRQLSEQLTNSDPVLRRGALLALKEVKPDDASIVSKIIRLGETDTNASVQAAAYTASALLAPESADVARMLVRALGTQRDQNALVDAANALAWMDTPPGVVLPDLLALLKDRSPEVRWSAARVLSAWGVYHKWGSDAGPAIAPLIAALNDTYPLARGTAAEALGLIGPQAKAAVIEITAALRDGRVNVFIASGALQGFGADAKAALPTLVERLKQEVTKAETERRKGKLRPRYSVPMSPIASLINALGSIGPAAGDTLPLIFDLADYEDPVVRSAVVLAFPAISADSARAVEVALHGTDDPDLGVQQAALRGLSAMGRRASAAVPAPAAKIRARNDAIRRWVVLALGAIGGKDSPAALRPALRDRSADVRIDAAYYLLKHNAADRESWNVLTEELQSQSAWPRTEAATRLGELGSAASAAVPSLVKLLKDDFDRVRAAAAEALGKIGPAAVVALPDLELVARDRERMVRQKAVQAIRQIKGAAH